jgi:hypothetical protein
VKEEYTGKTDLIIETNKGEKTQEEKSSKSKENVPAKKKIKSSMFAMSLF